MHDHEVTYSLTLPVTGRSGPRPIDWYRLVHDAWVATLGQHGVCTQLCPASEAEREDEFLCFQRRSAGDLLLNGWKIGGSAQRRRRRALLQHGSLLLKQSIAAPELPGIEQLAGLDLIATSWIEDWVREVGHRLGVAWETAPLGPEERRLACREAETKFGAPKWALRR